MIQAHGQNLNVDKLQGSCYTGLAVLRLKTAASNCQDRARDTGPLTAPMDLATDLPWDCMESLVVSVEGCKVSIIPMRNASALLPGFSCNWLEYRGYVDSTTSAQLAAWTRPISAARWVLYNTNLTSWRQQGVGTVSIGSLVRALEHVQRRDPNLPISQLMRQQELVALLKNYRNFNMQLDADESADEAAAPVAEVAEAAAAQAAAEAKPVQSDKPVLPPGVEADGTGLVSSPVEWQKKLADMFNGNGSLLHADVPNNIIVLFHNRRCNLTYEIVSGGLLTLGEVDRSTVGKLAMPAIEPFREPYVLEVQPDALAQAASGSSGGWLGLGNMFGPQSKSAKVSMVVIIAVLGAVLLGAVMCLCVRLARAGKHRHEYVRGSVFDDGVGVRPVPGGRLSQRQPGATAGMSRLERHAQSLRETGQSTAHSSSIIPCLTWRRRK
ncbi:hypothetical protein OEZ85_002464 [Tetradesmus obliquus]|uniref:Uncharacterized protein n=1 Tax=Tetradesmus obliquus TaxID=3088 RepID=A0ABY8U047_TETOB|nr:hypothetical protein OEZ85_002464 [Tetradesmus obliquus]